MSTISIALPPIEADDTVEVEVSVNGRKRNYRYRVELLRWENFCAGAEQRAECLRRMIERYDRRWQLMEIGTPTEADVPVMFRRIG